MDFGTFHCTLPKNLSISPCATGRCPGPLGTIPVDGLCPKIPLKKEGILILYNQKEFIEDECLCNALGIDLHLVKNFLSRFTVNKSYLPPTSEPIPKIEAPDAIIEPSPPEDPPHIRPG